MSEKSRAAQLREELARLERQDYSDDLRFRVVGHIDGHYSLSGVNRGLAIALDRGPGSVVVNHYHGHRVPGLPGDMADDLKARIVPMIQQWDINGEDDASRVSICQHYPLTYDSRPARLKIGFFFWEESLIPEDHIDHFNRHFQAMLVSSEFVRKTLRDSGCVLPIKVVPLGIDQIADVADRGFNRLMAGKKLFRFLHVSSAFPRKGIDILLAAYFSEFSGQDDVELVIKTFANVHNDLHEQVARHREAHRDAPRLSINEQPLRERELVQLYRTADAVVLPTRGEGFNLPAAEAMSLGLPVIATGYGGQADFLTSDTGWRLDYDFAPSQSHLAKGGALWLEPNVEDLRQTMRRFIDGRRDAAFAGDVVARAKEGADLVRAVYRWKNAGLVIRDYTRQLVSALPHQGQAPVRLAWISSWSTRCGIAEYSRMLVNALEPDRFQISHFCDTRTGASDGVYPLFSLGMSDSVRLVFEAVVIHEFDATVVQHQQSLIDIFAAAPLLAQLQQRAPVFVTFHATDFLTEADPLEISRLVRSLMLLERLIVHTTADLQTLKQLGLVNNTVVIPHGIPVAQLDQDAAGLSAGRRDLAMSIGTGDIPGLASATRMQLSDRLGAGEFWIGTFGFLLPHKGLEELVKAMRILHDRGHLGVRLLILSAKLDGRSDKFMMQLEDTIADNGLKDAITLVTDFIPVEGVSRILGSMDLITYAYQRTAESSSGAVRIGLSVARPVLTTPLPIFDDVRSFVFTSKDISSTGLAEAILPLLADRVLLDSRIDALRQWLYERSWPRISKRFGQMLQGVVAERRLVRPVDDDRMFARKVIADSTTFSMELPVCPPGVDLPKTGRARPWLMRVYSLGLPEDHLMKMAGGPKTVPVIWVAMELALKRHDGAADGEPLHRASSDRVHMRESILYVASSALASMATSQQAALFTYATRHAIRTVLVQDGIGVFERAGMLADLIVTDDADPGAVGRRLLKADERGAVALPQVVTQLDFPVREVTMLRNVSVSGPMPVDSPIVRAMHLEASAQAGPFRFGGAQSPSGGWTLLSGNGSRGGTGLPDLPKGRVALLIDMDAIGGWLAKSSASRQVIDAATAIIFETGDAYRAFFAMISPEAASVALIRRRAYLLEGSPAEAASSLVDRLARILREAAPFQLSDLPESATSLRAPPFPRGGKRLSICVSTYNRAAWLRVTLPLISEDIASDNRVEFLVVDNTSTDDTPTVLAELASRLNFRWVRNEKNVGMLGNLAVTSRLAQGDYVWILGDDDLVRPGTVAMVLHAIETQPRAELVYINYAYTHFDRPSDLENADGIVAASTPIAPETPSGLFETIKTFSTNNENLFTAIYACVFRRDHALSAYTQHTDGPGFSSLATCIPTTKYVLEHMMDRPGYWIGSHQIVVNMNVSWMKYAAVWHMERLPEAFDLAEANGADPIALMKYRRTNITSVIHFMSQGFGGSDDIRALLNMPRYVETAKRVPDFSSYANELFSNYDHITACQSKRSDELPTATIRAIYGV